MPIHDPFPGLPSRKPMPRWRKVERLLAWVDPRQARLRRTRRGKDMDEGGVPVEPNRPNTLSGGAAAPLEFDD